MKREKMHAGVNETWSYSWLTVWLKELFTFYHGIYFLMIKTNDRLSPYNTWPNCTYFKGKHHKKYVHIFHSI
jgi:hypothetical protein